jgi:8-oxo-dGTP pyrophosphatase MutT (NUDIX family)
MKPTNMDRHCIDYPPACENDPAAGSTSATASVNSNAVEIFMETTRKCWGSQTPEECAMASIKVPAAQSYGGVLFSEEGRVLLREPIDHLDGYVWTWPKGKPEKGETPAQTALREVYEETGYRARIIGVLPRVYVGTTRTNAFFLMEPVGEQGPVINETAQTRWVSYEEACSLIKLNKHAIGRNRDRAILDDALHYGPARNPEKIALSTRPGVGSLHPQSSVVLSKAEATISPRETGRAATS